MNNLKNLAKKLLDGERITLSQKKYNDSSSENPDKLINHLHVIIEESESRHKAIVVYFDNETQGYIHDPDEIYRIPVITDLGTLEIILSEVEKQSYL